MPWRIALLKCIRETKANASRTLTEARNVVTVVMWLLQWLSGLQLDILLTYCPHSFKSKGLFESHSDIVNTTYLRSYITQKSINRSEQFEWSF